MKKIIYICALVFLMKSTVLASSYSKIPELVKSYVKSHFPRAKSVHWERHGDNYIAHFMNVNTEVALCLSEEGQLLDRITEISPNDVPVSVKEKINMNNLVYVEKFEGRNGELFYILEIKLSRSRVEEIIFSKDGKEIKEQVIEETKLGDEKSGVLEF
jgi:hypothetical protein